MSAHVILVNLYYTLITTAIGMHVSASVFVGNSMGEKSINNAKRYTKLIFVMYIVLQILLGSILYYLRYPVISIFTSDID